METKTTHNKGTMLAEILVPLSLHYPQAGYTPAQLEALADDWCEDLADFSIPVLLDAVKMARRRERFFPSVAVIVEYANTALAARRADTHALEERTGSPDEWRRNSIFAAILAKSMSGNKRAHDFFCTKDMEEKDVIAAEILGDNYRSGEILRLCGSGNVLQ